MARKAKVKAVEVKAVPAWHVAPASELRMGSFFEDGYSIDEIFGVLASNAAGRRFAYVGPVLTDSRQAALDLVARIKAHQEKHPEWSPLVRPQYWAETDPVYGSEEYQRQGCEAARAERERADDPFYYADAVKLMHAL